MGTERVDEIWLAIVKKRLFGKRKTFKLPDPEFVETLEEERDALWDKPVLTLAEERRLNTINSRIRDERK